MSDQSTGPGSWQADNGKWYPAEARSDYSPGRYGAPTQVAWNWWMADDGRWYPPKLVQKGPGMIVRAWRWASIPVRIVAGLILVLSLTVAGVLIYRASQPTAQEKVFLNDLAGVQRDESDDSLIQTGHDMCDALRNGESPGALTRYFGADNALAVGLQHAQFLIAITAPQSICPDQAGRVAAWVNKP